MALDADRQAVFEKACSHIDARRLRRRLQQITAIHSPTGAERSLAEFLLGHLTEAGVAAALQPMGDESANVHARLAGRGGGASVLLYTPIDTHLEADPAIDVPWVGQTLRQDMRPIAADAPLVDDPEELVIGLGAANPKGMAATLIEAFLAIQAAGIPLAGDLLL